MVDFMLRHGAKPFVDGDFTAARIGALAQKIFVAEFCEDAHGFSVEALHEGQDALVIGGEFWAVGDVAALMILNIFRKHETFRDGDVAQEIA